MDCNKVLDDAPAIAILDVGLPKLSGYELARELRSRGYQFPVLMLTARVSVDDKVSGLDAGADDYLAKPFEYAELLARVKALLRRSTITAGSSTMRVRDLSVDPVARRVERAGKVIDLTQKEYALLEYLGAQRRTNRLAPNDQRARVEARRRSTHERRRRLHQLSPQEARRGQAQSAHPDGSGRGYLIKE